MYSICKTFNQILYWGIFVLVIFLFIILAALILCLLGSTLVCLVLWNVPDNKFALPSGIQKSMKDRKGGLGSLQLTVWNCQFRPRFHSCMLVFLQAPCFGKEGGTHNHEAMTCINNLASSIIQFSEIRMDVKHWHASCGLTRCCSVEVYEHFDVQQCLSNQSREFGRN